MTRLSGPLSRLVLLPSILVLLITAFLVSDVVAEPSSISLAQSGEARLPIVVGPGASAKTQELAAELADYLGRISGGTFSVEKGDGSRGIVVGVLADFSAVPFGDVQFGSGPFAREEYLLRSTPEGLYLLGATEMAVSHAVWDLLYRLGHRQFFPGETWEVVPRNADLEIAIDHHAKPSFYARRIWYNWGFWGYNEQPYRTWCQRNRAVQGFVLNSGHAYEAILAANREAFEQHPEYLALVDGERADFGGDTKFCISNPGLRKLVVEDAVRRVKANPTLDSISMDPSDGGNWCECEKCKELGGVSTRVVTLANEVAEAINQLDLGEKYVGMYAYNRHSAPPEIDVHPKVIPSATTAFIGGGLTFDQVVDGWQARKAQMGTYDYLSVVDWDWNLPRGAKASRPRDLAQFLPALHAKGVRFYDAESGDCWGPCGLGYYVAGRVLWDINEAERVEEIIDDFLHNAFGQAAEPMREFYHLINEDRQKRPASDIVGRMYRQIDTARRATDDPRVLARLDDLTLYTRHAELYYALAAGEGSKEDVVRHAYRMRKTMMIHSYGLWSRLLTQRDALTDGHPMKSEEPFTAAELASILSQGIAHNEPVESGIESVEFSERLVPAAERLKLAETKLGSLPAAPQDRQRYALWVENEGDTIDLQVTVQKVWAIRPPQLRLYSPLEVSLDPVDTFTDYQPDGQTVAVSLKTRHAGLHWLEVIDGGDHTRIEWPEGMPVMVPSSLDSPEASSHFRGQWSMYFYVPKGTEMVGGWAARVANWAPRISGKLLNADGEEVLDFAEREEGWFKVPVAADQAGRLWKFEQSQGQRLLMTVPPYLTHDPQRLMLPEEVVAVDEAP